MEEAKKCPYCAKSTHRSEEDKKKITNHLARISGQINGIKKMVDDDRYCEDILMQLSAVDKSIKSLASTILKNHLHTCVKKAFEDGDEGIIDELEYIFKEFSK